MSLTPEALREKYGNALIMGVDADLVQGAQKDGYTCRKDAMIWRDGICHPLKHVISRALCPRLRCEAELDPSFKQIIPYVLVEHTGSDRIFATLRIGGEERLKGQISLGLGGHIDEGEDVSTALYRELAEEIDLQQSDIASISFCGYLFSDKSEVDSVHMGMVYRILTDREDILCQEFDKLTGRWYSLDELSKLRAEGRMESWSTLVYDAQIRGDDDGSMDADV